ncbi:MAG: M48 family metallopeptidase [Clostridiales bacterium]|nr:M48 family metallopeptidase [Clostridiales bacterium]
MMKTLTVDGITVTVERKAIGNLYLRLKKPDGHVVITCPSRTTDREIAAFVRAKRQWIVTHQARLRARPELQPHAYVTGERLPVWGELWTLEVRPPQEGRGKVTGRDGKLLLEIGPSTAEQREAAVETWYRRQMKAAVPPLLERCQRRTGLSVNRWQVRKMSSRWGSCNPAFKSITLNLTLAQYPPECLEMVMYHELTHLLEGGHNPRFYRYMDAFCPNWRQADAILKGKAVSGGK